MNGSVRRLIAHDLRAHGPVLAAWVLLVLAHPVLATVPWSDDTVALGWVLATALVATRILLTVVLIAAVVQADSPIDDRSFWRTRPVPPSAMAAAKLALVVSVFVVIPLGVVLGTAAWLGVPTTSWPAVVSGVVLGEAPLVLLSTALAAHTHRTSTAVVGLVVVLLLMLAVEWLLLATVFSFQPWLRSMSPTTSLAAFAAWTALSLNVAAIAVWWGDRGRTAVWASAAAAVSGLFLLWLVPTTLAAHRGRARAQPAPSIVRLEVRRDRDKAVRLAAVVAHPFGAGTHIMLTDVSMLVGDRPAQVSDAAVPLWPAVTDAERAVHLLDLSDASLGSLQGQTVRLRAQVVGSRVGQVAFGRMPLAPGGRISSPRLYAVVERVHRPTENSLAVADLLAVRLHGTGLTFAPDEWSVLLRDRTSGVQRQLRTVVSEQARLAAFLRLPVIARPFEVGPLSLAVQAKHVDAVGGQPSDLEFVHPVLDTTVTPVATTLPVPTLPPKGLP